MNREFDANDFIDRIGRRLVAQFDDAKTATTPSLIGGAMEKPVRDQLEQILPRGIAVGSGCVIDTHGRTSRQQDIVLYERDICPVFSINDTPETTYYPCEGVIAVGEVKSTLNRERLTDAFQKVESVKRLRRMDTRHAIPMPDTRLRPPLYRSYSSLRSPDILDIEERNEHDHRNQIFGFILSGQLRMRVETLHAACLDLTRQTGDAFSPNLFTVLTGQQLAWFTTNGPRRVYVQQDGRHLLQEFHDASTAVAAAQDATHLAIFNGDAVFRSLINWIYHAYTVGTTSAASAFEHYIRGSPPMTFVDYSEK